MGLLKWLKGDKRPQTETAAREQCSHPVQYQEVLHEDQSNRHRVTGVKCTRCGERIQAAA